MEEAKAIVPLNAEPAELIKEESVEMSQVQARTISKFAEASIIEYTDHERNILFAPIDANEIKVRPDGQVYLEWAWYAERMDAAFGQGQWSLSPAPWNPRLYRENNITYREYVLWIRGQFAANAVGHHEEQRKTTNFGDAAEATYANALVRCCKRIGMARDLWKKDKIEEFKVLLKQKAKDQLRGSSSNRSTVIDVPPSTAPQPSNLDAYLVDIHKAEKIGDLKAIWTIISKDKSLTGQEFLMLEVAKNEKKEQLNAI